MTHPQDKVQAYANNTVVCTCVGYGKPVPYITWERNSNELGSDSRITITESLVTDSSGVIYVESVLKICDSRVSDSNWYSCTAENELGRDVFSFELSVIVEGIIIS